MFLATTAIEEFWSKNEKKILLAGEWCRVYKKKYSVKTECLPFVWNDVKDVHRAQVYCSKIYENTLLKITDSINNHLGINKETDYYRILLGNWLIHFIHQAYDKYQILEFAKKADTIFTWTLEERQYYYPFDFNDYALKTHDDIYQLQLFSEVVRFMEIPNRSKKITNPIKLKENLTFDHNPRNIKKAIKKGFLLLANSLKRHRQVVIVNPYIKRYSLLLNFLLCIKSPGKLVLDSFQHFLNIKNKPIFLDFRTKKKEKSQSFSSWITQFALCNIPQCYLEYHHDFRHLVKGLYPTSGNCFFTYNDLYGNVPFQFFLASQYKNQFIASAQHGCDYGMAKRHEGEAFERSITNRFYTYGWTDSKQTRPLPMPKLFKERKKIKFNGNILFLTAIRPRYITRFQQTASSTKNLSDHVEFPLIFFRKLDSVKSLIIRHHNSHGVRKWNNRERIKAHFPNIAEDKNSSFYKTLESCKVFVSDHIGTSFLEAMQANIPSLVFINRTSYLFRKDFQSFVKSLQNEKILFFDPEKAAEHLNYVNHNIDLWWGKESLQRTRKFFVQHHGLTSDNWIDDWKTELFAIVDKNS